MKLKVILAFLSLWSFTGSCQTNTRNSSEIDKVESGKTLIVYLSRTKNTKAVAEMIQSEMGGDLVELELVNPYPEDYRTIVDQVARENESGFLPPLKTKVDLSQYELIFLGFPTWGMQMPPPMKSFLSSQDLSGKMVIPFNTNAGYGVGRGFDQVKELCPKATILEGFSTRGGIERDGILFVMEGNREVEVRNEVKKWLKKIKILE